GSLKRRTSRLRPSVSRRSSRCAEKSVSWLQTSLRALSARRSQMTRVSSASSTLSLTSSSSQSRRRASGMRGKSQLSHDAVLREFEPVASAAGKDGLTLSQQLFSVVDALDSAGSLRRELTDPSRPGTDKSALVRSLFSELDERVQDALASFVNQRWSGEHDLSQSIEDAGVTALLAYAQ